MLKLAVIFESSPFDRKGLFNAVHQRIRQLVISGECEVDAYCIHSRDNAFTRKVRHTPATPDVDTIVVDEITYKILWYDFNVIDHVTVNFLHRKPLFFRRFMDESVSLLEGYDVVCAHSFTGALFAEEASRRYGMPFLVTWHGSDVHSHPWKNPLVLEHTRRVMDSAAFNLYVSKALMLDSERISHTLRKDVLYNGVSDAFRKADDMERSSYRNRYGLSEDDKVIAFAGSLVSVKNVDMLQPIFHEIQAHSASGLRFWVIGDGKLRANVESAMMADNTIDVRMWGNVPSENMPSMMNCIDALILPSRNEGLPLVCAEAIRCGAYVAGADVGGVAEVIGKDHVVPHGPGFVSAIADKVLSGLSKDQVQSVPEHMDWQKTAAKELSIIRNL